jgi:peptidyl-prolyl cis-trans isomerase D
LIDYGLKVFVRSVVGVLKVLRKKRQSILINGLMAIIIGVFIFWGIGSVIADRVEVVATVNGEPISQTELTRATEGLTRSFRQMSPNATLPPELVRSQALDQLITGRLFKQEAKKLGLQITDEELRESITRIPVFQIDNRFSKDQYLRTLQANQRSPAEFEDAQREQVLKMKLEELITAGAHVSTEEVRERYRYDNERVNLRYVRIVAADFLPTMAMSDADREAYFNAHREEFREPERARIEYVLFNPKNFAAEVTPTDEDIQARYEANPDDYRQPEQVHVRNIFFKLPPVATPEEKEAVRARATDVLKQLDAGGDFAALAKQYSEDPTANAGGDLGWIGRGKMVPKLDQTAFDLAPGAMSGVLESPSGFHIIKVEDKRPERVEPLDEARPKIVDAIKLERARELALQAVEKAHDRLLDRVDFTTVANDAHVDVQTPPPFAATETIAGLGGDSDLLKVIFETPTGEIGDIVSVDNGYLIFRVVERIDSAVPELTAIRNTVDRAARNDRARQLAKERAEALLKRLQETKDIDALAAAENLEVEETGPVGRTGGHVPVLGNVPALKRDAFALTPESPVGPAVYEAERDAVIVVLKERLPADEASFALQEKTLSDQSRRQVENALLLQFVNHLKANAQIDIDPGYGGTVGG